MGMGIGDWGLGPIPNPHYYNKLILKNKLIMIIYYILYNLNYKFYENTKLYLN